MKYFLLDRWVGECRTETGGVEQLLLSPPALTVVLKSGTRLVLYYRSSQPLPFFVRGEYPLPQPGTQVWPALNNSLVRDISLADNDRIITFEFLAKDIFQSGRQYLLIFECMPPLGNVILCSPEAGRPVIMDALHKYSYADNPQRQILPGLTYEPPRTGFEPQREEIAFPLTVKPAAGGGEIPCVTVNEYFRVYYEQVITQREAVRRAGRARAQLQKELARAEKKLAQQQAELDTANQEQTWLQWAELVKANLDKIRAGDTELEAVNYFDPELKQVKIPLLPDKHPQENLRLYVKKYRKAKQGRQKIGEQIRRTEAEIEQLKLRLQMLEAGQAEDQEMETGVATPSVSGSKSEANLLRLAVDADWEIIIGRKARENDLIVTRIGRKSDWWFHSRIYHGSHVLLRNLHNREPGRELVELCCGLAAWFSKARHSQNVPVDYTQLRYVRKPRKSAPGFVTYTDHKTVFADPLDVSAARYRLNGHAG